MAAIGVAGTSIDLVGGLLLENGTRIDRVDLRQLSGHEEDWLARTPGATNAEATTELIAACLEREALPMPPRQFARQLLVGDRDLLMIALRRLTLGDVVAAVYGCPECAGKMDVTLDLAEVVAEGLPQSAIAHDLVLGDGRRVQFRLPNGEDQEAVARMPADDAVAELLRRCLIESAPEMLSDGDRQAISDEMERLAPNVDIELDLICPECGHSFLATFDVAAFFLAELASSHQTLLREVHYLAFHYGWSEQAILNLDRTRRRAYLALLADELRPE